MIAVTIAFQSVLHRGTMKLSCNKISYCPRAIPTSRRNRLSSRVFRPCMRSEPASRISLRRRREKERERVTKKTQGAMRRRVTLARAPAEMTFARAKVCPPLGNNAGESLSLDGTPRRAEPKTARRWTEKEAGKRKEFRREMERGERRTEERASGKG